MSFFIFSSCRDRDVSAEEIDPEIRELIFESTELDRAINQDRLLRLSSQRDRQGLQQSLVEARHALRRLSVDPRDPLGIELGFRAVKEYRQHLVVRGEVEILDRFFEKVGRVVARSAKLAGIDLRDLDWRLFSFDFSTGLSPFGSFSTASDWFADISLDKSYARVRGPHNKSWLVTPGFDLSSVDNPAFQITHQTRVDRNTNRGDSFNRSQINQLAFKAYVSTDYQGGDPQEATWEELDLSPLPSGTDFHTIESPKVSLSGYASENTSIAFVLDANRNIIGSHYIDWIIQSFHLFGAGELKSLSARLAPIHEHLFNQNSFLPFQQLNLTEGGPNWEPFGFGDSIRYAKIETNGTQAENWLLSPKYRIENTDSAYLEFQETFRNPTYQSMEILISTNYSGGDPNLSDWEKLERTPLGDSVDPSDWIDIKSGPYDMSDYLGKDFVIGFRYIPQANENHVWEVESLRFLAHGGRVRTTSYDLDFSGDDNFSVYKNFNFSQNDQGFIQETIEGDPATWSLKERSGRQYFNVSGFDQKNVGKVRLLSPVVNLKNQSYVQIEQALNFYPANQHHKGLIKAYVISVDDQQEYKLDFSPRPAGNNWTVVKSLPLELPQELIDREVRFAFDYESDEQTIPNWDIYYLKVMKEL